MVMAPVLDSMCCLVAKRLKETLNNIEPDGDQWCMKDQVPIEAYIEVCGPALEDTVMDTFGVDPADAAYWDLDKLCIEDRRNRSKELLMEAVV